MVRAAVSKAACRGFESLLACGDAPGKPGGPTTATVRRASAPRTATGLIFENSTAEHVMRQGANLPRVSGVAEDNAATPGEQRPLKAGGGSSLLYRAPRQLESRCSLMRLRTRIEPGVHTAGVSLAAVIRT